MHCQKCGKENAGDADFCQSCGSALVDSTQDSLEGAPTFMPEEMATSAPSADSQATVNDEVFTPDSEPEIYVKSSEEPGEQTGKKIAGRYEIIRCLGREGMGVVYLAKDDSLGREVAIKRLLAPAKGVQRGIERFMREAKAIAALNHRNVLTIYELSEDEDGPFIVMENLEGGNLSELISSEGKLEVSEAIDMMKPVAQALAHAHRKGIVHRDIKPSNILFDSDKTPKLVDFGLARISSAPSVSMTGHSMGTQAYMSPEQRRDAKGADHRSDIYSLGKTFYYMITGESPDAIDLDAVPENVRDAVKKALKPKAEDRPFSVEEFMQMLNVSFMEAGASEADESEQAQEGCHSCGHSNPENAKYCLSCGAGLWEQCPKCETEYRAGTRFCGECGTDMPVYSEARDALQQAQAYLEKNSFSRAVKSAKAGLKTGMLNEELQAVLSVAEKKNAELKDLRAGIKQCLREKNYEEASEKISAALKLKPAQEDLVKAQNKLPDLIKKREAERDVQKTPATAANPAKSETAQSTPPPETHQTSERSEKTVPDEQTKGKFAPEETDKKIYALIDRYKEQASKARPFTRRIKKQSKNNYNQWYDAAQRGMPEAQWLMGLCAAKGWGTQVDPECAAEWYEKSAEQDFSVAQIYLASCYRDGFGLARDRSMSQRWFDKAKEDFNSGKSREYKIFSKSALASTYPTYMHLFKIHFWALFVVGIFSGIAAEDGYVFLGFPLFAAFAGLAYVLYGAGRGGVMSVKELNEGDAQDFMERALAGLRGAMSGLRRNTVADTTMKEAAVIASIATFLPAILFWGNVFVLGILNALPIILLFAIYRNKYKDSLNS